MDVEESIIRPLQRGDEEQIIKLFDEWFPVKYPPEFSYQICRYPGKYQTKAIVTKGNKILALMLGQFEYGVQVEQPAWSMTKRKRGWGDHYDTAFHILLLGVRKELRRQGLAKKLMDLVIVDCIQQKNTVLIYLHASVANDAAIKFYKKCGFIQSHPIRALYKFGNGRYGDAFMFVMEIDKPYSFCTVL
ncbi:putative N-alpha-acetyltransferase 60 [Monocercomonoides exilis]|uniref:putative N-alpha-acetyltransferase 60 n=1 Tax=Monocercomonoides exilis TaxID=2049356 RepID=UPI00355A5EBA|nr:putative N-alpha-acetyltransferase 60 [Monocercomonoides exilis]|eukprot:MONOS_6814.1-p1 / transcript=MONOS_6814.1 / gene=MONOS_6814 / organism=Monocercomonoides_exilis_PA203 / gene_product=unspecified product / transcript_product=unspecified product / location=Mono_scaffold00222:15408-16104(-) / protein_length=188 / sequence_SO=supercontig / SO=protein_coding / is_pseudo=false